MPMFNEPELFLLRGWPDARLLEEAMKTVREKYAAIFEKVLDKVQENHEELDSRETRLTKDTFNVRIGKKSWRSEPKFYISGFGIGRILMENLTSEDEDAPDKTIWINHPIGAVDIEEARKKLREAAKSILSKEAFRHADFDLRKGFAGITHPILKSRAELFDLLIKDEARGFIECMVAEFESMTKFTAILDEIHATGK